MVIEYIRYKLPLEQVGIFIQSYQKASTQLDASEHCLAYELSACEEEAGVFILRIEWTSTEEHLNGFRKSAVFPPFLASIRAFIGNIEEMRHYRVTEVAKRK